MSAVPPIDRLLLAHGTLEFARLAFAAGLLAALLVLGRSLGRALLGDDGDGDAASRALVELAMGFAAYATVVRLAAAAGLATRGVVLGLLLPPALLALRRRDRLAVPRGPAPTSAPWPLRLALLAVALLPLPMALAPSVSLDALTYQLRMPELTLRTGRWPLDPANTHTFFPAATQCLYLPALAVDSSGTTAQLVHWGFFLLSLAALLCLARRLGAGAASGWAPLLFGSIPAAGIVAGWAWSDMPLVFALLSSALALTLPGGGAAALGLLGLAAAIKYSGLLLALPLFAAVLVVAGRGRLPAPRLLLGAAAGLAVAAPWYAANLLATGNPVYPLLSRVLGGPAGAEGNLLHWASGGKPGGGAGWWSYVATPGTLDGDLGGPLALVLFAAVLVHALRRRTLRGAAVLALAGAVALVFFEPTPRVFLPVLAGACALAGPAMADWKERRARVGFVGLAALVALRGVALAAAHNAFFFGPLPCAVGIEPAKDYVVRNFPPAALYGRSDAELPEGALVLSAGEPRLFGFPRPTVASAVTDPPAVQPYLRGTPDAAEAARRLRARGVTHLLVDLDWLARPGTSPSADAAVRLTAAETETLRRLLAASAPVDREGALVLVRLPS